jgi:integrase
MSYKKVSDFFMIYYDWLKKFCKRNDLPFYGIHTFRHFIASILITGGTDVTTVSRTLGHSNSSTTLNIYSHLFQTAQLKAADTIEKALDFEAKNNLQQVTKSAT